MLSTHYIHCGWTCDFVVNTLYSLWLNMWLCCQHTIFTVAGHSYMTFLSTHYIHCGWTCDCVVNTLYSLWLPMWLGCLHTIFTVTLSQGLYCEDTSLIVPDHVRLCLIWLNTVPYHRIEFVPAPSQYGLEQNSQFIVFLYIWLTNKILYGYVFWNSYFEIYMALFKAFMK